MYRMIMNYLLLFAIPVYCCNSTYDCPEGTECVAGSSIEQIQYCVPAPACGARSRAGNCPPSDVTGNLVCAWIENNGWCNRPGVSCLAFGERKGIFKCLSPKRCDDQFDSACSGNCKSENGMCNGQGTCVSNGPNGFQCDCNAGWSGDKCTVVENGSCFDVENQCNNNGKCISNTCTCDDGFSGQQCEIPDLNGNEDSSLNTEDSAVHLAPPENGEYRDNVEEEQKKSGINALLIVLLVSGVAGIVIIALIIISKRSKSNDSDTSNSPAVDPDITNYAQAIDNISKDTNGGELPLTPKSTIALI